MMHKTVSHEFNADWMNARYCDEHSTFIIHDNRNDSVNLYDVDRSVMLRMVRNWFLQTTPFEPHPPLKWTKEDLTKDEVRYLEEVQSALTDFFLPPSMVSKEVKITEQPKKRGPGRPKKNQ